MFQIACIENCMSFKLHMLQIACVANCTQITRVAKVQSSKGAKGANAKLQKQRNKVTSSLLELILTAKNISSLRVIVGS